jgi:hypothetical protein
MTLVMKYRGRTFSQEELIRIQEIITSNWNSSRNLLSRKVCEELNWHRPDGGLKDMACRCAFLKMEKDGLLNLRPVDRTYGFHKIRGPIRTDRGEAAAVFCKDLKDLADIRVEMAQGKEEKALWSELVDRYHYLGYTRMGGAQLRYLIKSGDSILGCIGWSAAAWKTASRDNFIGWNPDQRERTLHFVVNNSRFLILPWVNIKCLASKVLGLSARRLSDDWQTIYKYRPVLLETFVEKQKFVGTCYKAANWELVGETTGRGRYDRYNNKIVPVKTIWLYPLTESFRETLCR